MQTHKCCKQENSSAVSLFCMPSIIFFFFLHHFLFWIKLSLSLKFSLLFYSHSSPFSLSSSTSLKPASFIVFSHIKKIPRELARFEEGLLKQKCWVIFFHFCSWFRFNSGMRAWTLPQNWPWKPAWSLLFLSLTGKFLLPSLCSPLPISWSGKVSKTFSLFLLDFLPAIIMDIHACMY